MIISGNEFIMLDSDYVCRSLMYPLCGDKNVFSEEAAFSFTNISDPNVYCLSVGSRRLLKSVEGAHEFGKKIVRFKNYAIEKSGAAKAKRYYLGFYDFYAEIVNGCVIESVIVRLRWKPENDMDEHFQVEVILNDSGISEKKFRRLMVTLRTLIVGNIHGPHRHVDTADILEEPTLGQIEIPDKLGRLWP